MDLQNLVQQKIQEKALSKAAKASNKPTPVSVPAKKILDPTFTGSLAIASMMNTDGHRDTGVINAVKDGVEKTLAKVKVGNLEDLEAILVNQVYVLNGLFNQLVSQGKGGLFEPAVVKALPNHPKTMLNVALKAQNQTRATIQTINDLKNPKKTTFIKNQLNNVQMEVEGIKEQLEDVTDNGSKELDAGTEATTIPVDPKVEAVEVIDGRKDSRR